MDIDEARRAKAGLTVLLREAMTVRASASGAAPDESVHISLGLAPRADGTYAVALRYPSGVPTAQMLVRRAVAHLGEDAVDARRTGAIRPLARSADGSGKSTTAAKGKAGKDKGAKGDKTKKAGAKTTKAAGTTAAQTTSAAKTKTTAKKAPTKKSAAEKEASRSAPARVAAGPVPTARAAGDTGRVRPLRPGVSIGRLDTTAGTLGAFVRVDGSLHALSNHHVLAGADPRIGDPVVQPGPFDGGTDPDDTVGTLAAWVPLHADPVHGTHARADAAVAALTEPGVDPGYPAGLVTRTAEVAGTETVEKVGRSTGTTRGRITAIELDGLVVDYGEAAGELTFDGQIEVEGADDEPFSRPGDSGSLVYVPDAKTAIGLLFAGSESGGGNGKGLTYLNPIGTVLEALGATLLGAADEEVHRG